MNSILPFINCVNTISFNSFHKFIGGWANRFFPLSTSATFRLLLFLSTGHRMIQREKFIEARHWISGTYSGRKVRITALSEQCSTFGSGVCCGRLGAWWYWERHTRTQEVTFCKRDCVWVKKSIAFDPGQAQLKLESISISKLFVTWMANRTRACLAPIPRQLPG